MKNRTQVIENLLVSQMIIRDELETSTIRFFRKLYPSLITLKEISTKQMAELIGFTEVAATNHRRRLEENDYLLRVDYRKWKLNPHALEDPLLTIVLDLNIQLYDDNGVVRATKGA